MDEGHHCTTLHTCLPDPFKSSNFPTIPLSLLEHKNPFTTSQPQWTQGFPQGHIRPYLSYSLSDHSLSQASCPPLRSSTQHLCSYHFFISQCFSEEAPDILSSQAYGGTNSGHWQASAAFLPHHYLSNKHRHSVCQSRGKRQGEIAGERDR